ncbi:hypothetical protein I316_04565 [Kwoniella heveanensis BCC8398]|uniref:Nudix hydrolase domain-containing protein n=1 Tax=Kwoniella heveanensis BCC8398 TaxID=1296120 RepID=A0A1B9GS54_9TREE|nr:hypothetical protein I316_04565 [Kwoniella heveanensis BCC8398]
MGIESLLPPLKPESLHLFVGRLGDLYVLLSTRAGNMRTYAHDTALPGGKYEEGDVDAEGTAIGLPMDREKVRLLCTLGPFLTGNSLIVTPVILLITDHTLVPLLNPSEVQSLFSMPLSAFLHSRPSSIPSFHYRISHRLSSIPSWVIDSIPPPPEVRYAEDNGVVGGKEGGYYGYRDVSWGEGKVRMHRFLTGREALGVKPVYGLTAAILIRVATIGYDTAPDFAVLAPGQKKMQDRIAYEITAVNGPLRRAVEAEDLLEEWMDRSGSAKVKAKL